MGVTSKNETKCVNWQFKTGKQTWKKEREKVKKMLHCSPIGRIGEPVQKWKQIHVNYICVNCVQGVNSKMRWNEGTMAL